MEMLSENVQTIIITVVSGVLVYIIGEILQTVWLAPLQKFKSIKHDVSVALTYYARVYTNVIDWVNADEDLRKEYDETADKLRELACEVKGFIETLSWFKLGIPSKKRLNEAYELLMLLSNSLFSPAHVAPTTEECRSNKETAEQVYAALGMYSRRKKKHR